MSKGKLLYRSKSSANWDLHPVVEGQVLSFDTLQVDNRKTKVMLVDAGERLVQVFMASQLEDLFSHAKVGNQVRIEYLGTKDITGGKKVRLFDCQLYEGQGASDAEGTAPTRRRRS